MYIFLGCNAKNSDRKCNIAKIKKESLTKRLLHLLRVFGNENFSAVYEVTGIGGLLFWSEIKKNGT